MADEQEATCTRCGEVKPADALGRDKRKRNGLQSYCRSCMRSYGREHYRANCEDVLSRQRSYRSANPGVAARWRERNRDHVSAYQRARHEDERRRVIEHFGGECAQCCSTDRLELDHVAGDGAQHRAEVGPTSAIYRQLLANDFRSDYELQVLCHGCHRQKTRDERRSKVAA